ncbi:hypothetical protein ABS772_06250 [Methylorubrum podarium]|uniref:Uncharacterized protein n=1 Tax=Methylorubrum podarium TaxID=200476 RepID=A0ABV1QJH3_9HYPH
MQSDFGRGGVKVGADAVAAGMVDRVQTYERSLVELTRTASAERRAARAARG